MPEHSSTEWAVLVVVGTVVQEGPEGQTPDHVDHVSKDERRAVQALTLGTIRGFVEGDI